MYINSKALVIGTLNSMFTFQQFDCTVNVGIVKGEGGDQISGKIENRVTWIMDTED